MDGRTIPIANLQRSAATLSCNGCKHLHYSAPGGQAWNRQPHSYCRALRAAVPMVVENQDHWVSSEIPPGCPEHQQPELF